MRKYINKIDSLKCEYAEIRPSNHSTLTVDLDDVCPRSFVRGCSDDLLEAIICELGEDKIKAIFAKVDAEEAGEVVPC